MHRNGVGQGIHAIAATLIGVLAASCADDRRDRTVPPAEPRRYEVYFLGGQSNMEGYGRIRELPRALRKRNLAVPIFHGNSAPDETTDGGMGRWSWLAPGHGVQFSSDGNANRYSDRFGPELTFAHRMLELRPQARIALVKYARGATSIDSLAAGRAGSWDPEFQAGRGINQYDHLLATVGNAFANTDVDGDGVPDELIPAGIVWMQGEADAGHAAAAARYGGNLERLMNLIRAAFDSEDLPVVIGRISDSGRRAGRPIWRHGNLVRDAQAAFVERDPHAALVVTTDTYGYSDPSHYDSAGYMDLGRRFAEAMDSLHTAASAQR